MSSLEEDIGMSELESEFESDMGSDYELGKIHALRVKNSDGADVDVTFAVVESARTGTVKISAYKDNGAIGHARTEYSLYDLKKNSDGMGVIGKHDIKIPWTR